MLLVQQTFSICVHTERLLSKPQSNRIRPAPNYARTFNPPHRLGTASGIVNVGGFGASLVTILLVGLVLDVVGSGETYSLQGFRVALSVQYVLWGVGLAGILLTRRAVRAQLARDGVHVTTLAQMVRARLAPRG